MIVSDKREGAICKTFDGTFQSEYSKTDFTMLLVGLIENRSDIKKKLNFTEL